MLRVASVNANKGCYNAARRKALLSWLVHVKPDLLLLQEPWPVSREVIPSFGSLSLVRGDSNLAAYALSPALHAVRHSDERWLGLQVGASTIHGVYFPADTRDSRARADFLERLGETVRSQRDVPHAILGDFNLAPTELDGVYGDRPSGWTSTGERRALEALLSAGPLADTGRDPENPNRFTFERSIRGKPSQFRCDLALVDRARFDSGRMRVSFDHTTRRGSGAFTDHSAIILDVAMEMT